MTKGRRIYRRRKKCRIVGTPGELMAAAILGHLIGLHTAAMSQKKPQCKNTKICKYYEEEADE